MILSGILGALASLSFILMLWQWLVARRFPLHQRIADRSFAPAVTLLKPLKGCDAYTEDCLRSWFAQDYAGESQLLFAVDDANDPVCSVVKKLLGEFPRHDAQLIICPGQLGTNAKVSKLAQLEPHVKHELIVVSDADVNAPVDLLANAGAPLRDDTTGLVSCFYQLANPTTLALRWEAVAINADFWSQVLQSRSLQPLDFALGAVMVTRRRQLAEIGGFRAVADYLADDYQLGHRIARRGHRIQLCPVVAECWSAPLGWAAVWRHQLRWARTIRACQPLPYFFSILSNATLWPLLWWLASAMPWFTIVSGHTSDDVMVSNIKLSLPAIAATGFLLCRVLIALQLQTRLTQARHHYRDFWLVPVKDLLQVALWAGAFLGNRIEWRGERCRLGRDGTLEKI